MVGSFLEPSLREERCFELLGFSNAWGEIELEFPGTCVVMKGPKLSASPTLFRGVFQWS